MEDGLLQSSDQAGNRALLLAGDDQQRAAVTRGERHPKRLIEHIFREVVRMGNVGNGHPRADWLIGAPAGSVAEGLQGKCDDDRQGHHKAQDEQPLLPVDLTRFCRVKGHDPRLANVIIISNNMVFLS
jgi:hypothetical protein